MSNSVEIKEDLRSLKTLVRSQIYQLEKLNEINKRIDKLNSELQGDKDAERREKN